MSELHGSAFCILCSAFCDLRSAFRSFPRIAATILIIALTLAVGHYGFRPLLLPAPLAGAESGAPVADVPAPPGGVPAGRASGAGGNAALAYLCAADADEIARFYRREMPRRGWTAVAVPPEISQAQGPMLAYSNRAGVSCIIAVSRTGDGGSRVMIVRASAQRMNGAPAQSDKSDVSDPSDKSDVSDRKKGASQ